MPSIAKRVLAVMALTIPVMMIPGAPEVARQALSDAYLAVAVFVAGTLALVHGLERAFKTDLGHFLHRYQRWQVPVAGLLGAFPGCGGAIVAVTQYSRGYLSFGGVVATLTATMGDAMFLLLAREPTTGIGVLALGVVVGVISGYTVDAIHKPSFMRAKSEPDTVNTVANQSWKPRKFTVAERLWLLLMVPGIMIGLLAAFQLDVDAYLTMLLSSVGLSTLVSEPAVLLGTVGAALAVGMWVQRGGEESRSCESDESCTLDADASVARKLIDNTNFITTWVVFAFVSYELVVHASGIDLAVAFSTWGALIPAIAILAGFVPGCGPQIVVTSLYLSGGIPLSAQLGNAISNDGDALFPALAVAPKAALCATLYSAIPAVLVAYGYFFIWE